MKDDKRQTKPLTGHLDKWLQSAGTNLDSKTPRRTFIGRLTTGIIAIGGTGLILKPSEARADFCGITECRGTDTVGVCYSSWIVTNPAYRRLQRTVVQRRAGDRNVRQPNQQSRQRAFRTLQQSILVDLRRSGTAPRVQRFSLGLLVHRHAEPGLDPLRHRLCLGRWRLAGHCRGPAKWTSIATDAKSACPSYHGCGGNPAPSGTCSTAHWLIGTSGSDGSHERYYIQAGRTAPRLLAGCWVILFIATVTRTSLVAPLFPSECGAVCRRSAAPSFTTAAASLLVPMCWAL